jgi:poly(A) polymerase
MIKTFIDKLLGKSPRAAAPSRFGKREEVPAAVHGIDPTGGPARHRRGAHAQGRGLRGLHRRRRRARPAAGPAPKDFDVATNATPEQVKACSAAPSSSASAFASCTWSMAAGASTR